MQANNWALQRSALGEFLALEMSFSAIAKARNEKFGTRYRRNAAISRSKCMGLSGPDRAERRLERALNAKPARAKRSGRVSKVMIPEAPAPASPVTLEGLFFAGAFVNAPTG
jgi:hypothetical protein